MRASRTCTFTLHKTTGGGGTRELWFLLTADRALTAGLLRGVLTAGLLHLPGTVQTVSQSI